MKRSCGADGAYIVVEDGQGNLVTEATAPGVTASSVAFSSHGRLLRGKSVAVGAPLEAPAAAGVQPLGSRGSSGSTACDGRSWSLPLDAGQNGFKITVSPVVPVVQTDLLSTHVLQT